jgi:hypothetical protein
VVRGQPGLFRCLEGVARLVLLVSGEIFQRAGVDQLVQALDVDGVEDGVEGGDAYGASGLLGGGRYPETSPDFISSTESRLTGSLTVSTRASPVP